VIYSNQEVKRFPIKPNPLERGGGKRRVFIFGKKMAELPKEKVGSVFC
jgi:hypothetical protein